MKTETKLNIIRGGLSLAGSVVGAAFFRTLYLSLGLPDADIVDDHFIMKHIGADLLSSSVGLIFWEASLYLLKHHGYLRNTDYEIPIAEEEINYGTYISENEVPLNFPKDRQLFKKPEEHDNRDKVINFCRQWLPPFIAIGLGIGVGNLTRALYQTLGGPDLDMKLGPIVLEGTVTDMVSTAATIGIYEHKTIYKSHIKPMLSECRKRCGFFKSRENTKNLNPPWLVQSIDNIPNYFSIQNNDQ